MYHRQRIDDGCSDDSSVSDWIMATIAIGDIHGNSRALQDLLGQLTTELTAADTVVFLGDYIDRGPDSRGCIERILQFRAGAAARVVTLAGNHEDWLLRSLSDPTRHSWILGMDAFATIASYSTVAAGVLREALSEVGVRLLTESVELPYAVFFDAMPAEHLRFLRDLQLFHRSGGSVFVHGGVDWLVGPVEQQSRKTVLWGCDGFPEAYQGTDCVVYGHYSNAVLDAEGWPRPLVLPRSIGIDTIAHGVLTAVEIGGSRMWQSARHSV